VHVSFRYDKSNFNFVIRKYKRLMSHLEPSIPHASQPLAGADSETR
jgi:hypothetical protein